MNTVTPAAQAEQMPVIYTDPSQRPHAAELVAAAIVLAEKAGKYAVIATETDLEMFSELRARLSKHVKDLDSERLDMTAGARLTIEKVNAKFNAHIEPLKEHLKRLDVAMIEYRDRKKREAEAAERARREEEARLAREKAEAERKAREAREAAERAAREAEEARVRAEQAASEEERQRALQAAQTAHEAATRAIDTAISATAEASKLELEEQATALETAPAAPVKTVTGSYGSKTTFKENWTWEVVDISKVPEAYQIPPVDRLDKRVLNALAKSQKDKASVPGIRFFDAGSVSSRAAK